MALTLPSYQELSEEQDAVQNLPLAGHHLVVGPPGTGKSVMAIYRASMYDRLGRTSQFIVHNRPLFQYVEQLLKASKLKASVGTLYTWLPHWYKIQFGRSIPKSSKWDFNWIEAQVEALRRPPSSKIQNVIIDEGQDFPADFYRFLLLIAENITVFADENQRLFDNNCTIDQIRKMLEVPEEEVRYLTRNYRNTREIAAFAAHFYSGLTSGIPELPDRTGKAPDLILTSNWKDQVLFIRRMAETYRSSTIGVFVPWKKQQWRLYNDLGGKEASFPVQIYDSGNAKANKLNFALPGISILNHYTAKGLEFDVVILAALDQMTVSDTSDMTRMRFYVLSSRARRSLVLMSTDDQPPRMLSDVSPVLYERKRLVS